MPAQFSDSAKKKLDAIVSRYPNSQAACLPALHVAQGEFGYISEDVIHAVAEHLKLPAAHVWGVATFYTMFHKEPVGKNVLMMCTNVACMLRGGYDVLAHIEHRLGVKAGETTPDGQFTVIEEECLAACANAPALVCGTRYFLDLTPAKVDAAIDELRKNPSTENV